MFVGQYEHALDDKGRVVLPSPFRAFVADRGYVTHLDGCLGLWSADAFRLVAEKWKAELPLTTCIVDVESSLLPVHRFNARRFLWGRWSRRRLASIDSVQLSKELGFDNYGKECTA